LLRIIDIIDNLITRPEILLGLVKSDLVAGEGFEPSKVWGFTVPSHWPLGQPAEDDLRC